jgi:hypothetical protein
MPKVWHGAIAGRNPVRAASPHDDAAPSGHHGRRDDRCDGCGNDADALNDYRRNVGSGHRADQKRQLTWGLETRSHLNFKLAS